MAQLKRSCEGGEKIEKIKKIKKRATKAARAQAGRGALYHALFSPGGKPDDGSIFSPSNRAACGVFRVLSGPWSERMEGLRGCRWRMDAQQEFSDFGGMHARSWLKHSF